MYCKSNEVFWSVILFSYFKDRKIKYIGFNCRHNELCTACGTNSFDRLNGLFSSMFFDCWQWICSEMELINYVLLDKSAHFFSFIYFLQSWRIVWTSLLSIMFHGVNDGSSRFLFRRSSVEMINHDCIMFNPILCPTSHPFAIILLTFHYRLPTFPFYCLPIHPGQFSAANRPFNSQSLRYTVQNRPFQLTMSTLGVLSISTNPIWLH